MTGAGMLIDEDVRTTDVGEAESLIARVYRRGRILDSHEPFVFEQAVRGDERVNIARYSIASRAELAVDIGGVVGIGSRVSGSYRATSNGEQIDPGGAFVLAPGEAASWSEKLDLVMVNLDVAALRAAAGITVERGTTLRMHSLAPVSAAMQRRWDVVQRFAMQTVGDPELLGQELIRRSVTDVLLANALACFAIDFGATADAHRDGQPATLRRAVRFIEDNASRPIGVEEIAEAARLSSRGLQDLFHRSLGVTPTEYLRTVRLDGARRDLEKADAGEESVAGIANRWGFGHAARFAARYRAAYGEYPSDTLRG